MPQTGGVGEDNIDQVLVEVIKERLIGIVREMQNSLFCTGYSTIIRESKDASCAIIDPRGKVLAQHTVLPLHLGAFPACVEGVLREYPIESMADGDAFLVNHPYSGGSPHATDVAVIAPIFAEERMFGFSGSIAHKSDIGGLVPGSNSGQAREIFHEGVLLPPVRFYKEHEPVREIESILRANSRTPELVLGDLRGQLGASELGARRARELCDRYGVSTIHGAANRLIAVTEERIRDAVARWPDGAYEGIRQLHTEGIENGRPVLIHVLATIEGRQICFDFSGTDGETAGPYNIRPSLVRAVCYYVLKCLVGSDLPANAGFDAAVETRFRASSVVNSEPPAPVNTYMPVAMATAEALLDAIGKAVPAGRIAESSAGVNGTLSHVRSGSRYPRVQYELPAGAIGARYDRDGVSASKAHVANASIMPLEIIESEFPVEVVRFELVRDSGGIGRYRGGLGYVREYKLLGNARFTTRSGKELTPPLGKGGGGAGRVSSLILNPDTANEREIVAGDGTVELKAGDVLRIAQAGGGGFGAPLERSVEEVLEDVREGYVSPLSARNDYGVSVAVVEGAWVVNEEETQRVRCER